MPQLILLIDHAVPGTDKTVVQCPVCDSLLSTVKEQDKRVHIMLHPMASCRWANVKFRVDRVTGFAEPWPEEVHDDEAPTESA